MLLFACLLARTGGSPREKQKPKKQTQICCLLGSQTLKQAIHHYYLGHTHTCTHTLTLHVCILNLGEGMKQFRQVALLYLVEMTETWCVLTLHQGVCACPCLCVNDPTASLAGLQWDPSVRVPFCHSASLATSLSEHNSPHFLVWWNSASSSIFSTSWRSRSLSQEYLYQYVVVFLTEDANIPKTLQLPVTQMD